MSSSEVSPEIKQAILEQVVADAELMDQIHQERSSFSKEFTVEGQRYLLTYEEEIVHEPNGITITKYKPYVSVISS